MQIKEPASLTLDQWLHTLHYFDWRCAYCGDPYKVIEHFYPLGRGKGTTVKNCVPACTTCNTKKRNYHPFKTLISAQQLAEIIYFFQSQTVINPQHPVYVAMGRIGIDEKLYIIERAEKV